VEMGVSWSLRCTCRNRLLLYWSRI
jgi:hypothetical protein